MVDWHNVKFCERNFCDLVKMLGKFLAFSMTKQTPTPIALKKYQNGTGLQNQTSKCRGVESQDFFYKSQ